jgi:hypothetical protein
LYDYLEEDMTGNSTGTHATQTWIQFVDIQREYELDELHCDGFYDTNNVKINNAAELYSVNGSKVYRIPGYGYDVDQDNILNNSLVIDPKLFEGSPDTLLSFLMLPVDSLRLATQDDINVFHPGNAWNRVSDGVYCVVDGSFTIGDLPSTSGSLSNITDKSIDSFFQITYNLSITTNVGIGTMRYEMAFKMPKIPQDYSFTNVFIGLKLKTYVEPSIAGTNNGFKVIALKRGYIDRLTGLFTTGSNNEKSSVEIHGQEAHFDNVADFYTTLKRSENCKWFYHEGLTGTNPQYYSGHKVIDVNCSNLEEYEAIEQMIIGIDRPFTHGNYYDQTLERIDIYELYVALKSTASIKNEVYL